MLDLNPETVINKALFDKTIEHLKSFCQKVIEPCNSQMILTEGDFQAWVFHDLLYHLCNFEKEPSLGDTTNSPAIGIHCNLSFLDSNGKLNKLPDILLLDKKEYNEYKVNSSGNLDRRKGSVLWGSSILIKLKLFRTIHYENQHIHYWKKDIDKLINLKKNLYPPEKQEQFFQPLFLLGKRVYLMINLKKLKNMQKTEMWNH
jgi:hypothetical protein